MKAVTPTGIDEPVTGGDSIASLGEGEQMHPQKASTMRKRLSRVWLPVVVLAFGLLALVPFQAYAAGISDLQAGFDQFMANAQSLYRLDANDLDTMWEAYCGVIDPRYDEDKNYARDVGQQLQSREAGIRDELLSNALPKLLQLSIDIQQRSDTDPRDVDTAKAIQAGLIRQQQILENLGKGVILKGSNHPFVQFAIEYGKAQHKDMCYRYGDASTRACDQYFDGMDGRPDLVVMDGGNLMVYEFKPDNPRAKAKGEKQLKDYLPAVEAFYERFFVDGRDGGFAGDPPDSDHGGQAILDALANSPAAWSGKSIRPVGKVETYQMCDQRMMFN